MHKTTNKFSPEVRPTRFGLFWIGPANILRGGRRLEERELVVQIQVNTDENIEGGEELSARVSAEIRARLDHFSKHITRIEVHISDQDGDKSGESDKRCLIEARLEGRQPEVVSDRAATLERAYSGAAKKLQRALETTLGRLSQLKGADTIRTGDL